MDAWAGCGPSWPRAPHGSGASPDGSFGTGTPRLHWEGCAAACARPFTSLSPRPELSGPPLATNGQRSEAVVLDRGRCAPSVTWQRLGTLLAVAQGWGRRLRLAGRSQAAATCPHCPESPHSQDRQPEMPGPPGLRKWFSLEQILHTVVMSSTTAASSCHDMTPSLGFPSSCNVRAPRKPETQRSVGWRPRLPGGPAGHTRSDGALGFPLVPLAEAPVGFRGNHGCGHVSCLDTWGYENRWTRGQVD